MNILRERQGCAPVFTRRLMGDHDLLKLIENGSAAAGGPGLNMDIIQTDAKPVTRLVDAGPAVFLDILPAAPESPFKQRCHRPALDIIYLDGHIGIFGEKI